MKPKEAWVQWAQREGLDPDDAKNFTFLVVIAFHGYCSAGLAADLGTNMALHAAADLILRLKQIGLDVPKP